MKVVIQQTSDLKNYIVITDDGREFIVKTIDGREFIVKTIDEAIELKDKLQDVQDTK